MPILPVVQYPDSRLGVSGEKVEVFDEALKHIVDDMFETHYHASHCAALAAIGDMCAWMGGIFMACIERFRQCVMPRIEQVFSYFSGCLSTGKSSSYDELSGHFEKQSVAVRTWNEDQVSHCPDGDE